MSRETNNSMREAVIEKCILYLIQHHKVDEKKAYAILNDILCIIREGEQDG